METVRELKAIQRILIAEHIPNFLRIEENLKMASNFLIPFRFLRSFVV